MSGTSIMNATGARKLSLRLIGRCVGSIFVLFVAWLASFMQYEIGGTYALAGFDLVVIALPALLIAVGPFWNPLHASRTHMFIHGVATVTGIMWAVLCVVLRPESLLWPVVLVSFVVVGALDSLALSSRGRNPGRDVEGQD